MTVEHRVVVGLGDVRAITFECKQCHRRMSTSPDDPQLAGVGQCPFCGHTWFDDAKTVSSHYLGAFVRLLGAVGECRLNQGTDDVGALVYFEIDASRQVSPNSN